LFHSETTHLQLHHLQDTTRWVAAVTTKTCAFISTPKTRLFVHQVCTSTNFKVEQTDQSQCHHQTPRKNRPTWVAEATTKHNGCSRNPAIRNIHQHPCGVVHHGHASHHHTPLPATSRLPNTPQETPRTMEAISDFLGLGHLLLPSASYFFHLCIITHSSLVPTSPLSILDLHLHPHFLVLNRH